MACSCPDYIARHDGNGSGMCKHGLALCELGLMPPPAPVTPATSPVAEPPRAEVRDAKPVLMDGYQRDMDALRAWKAEEGVEDKAAPRPLLRCHRDSVHEEAGMPYCEMCFDRMIHTPAPAACCPPDEPVGMRAVRRRPRRGRGRRSVTPGAGPTSSPRPRSTRRPPRPPTTTRSPELDAGYEEWAFFRDAPAALPVDAEAYDPSAEDEAAYAAMIAQRHLDTSAVLSLPEAIDHVSDAFKAWGSPFGEMLARCASRSWVRRPDTPRPQPPPSC